MRTVVKIVYIFLINVLRASSLMTASFPSHQLELQKVYDPVGVIHKSASLEEFNRIRSESDSWKSSNAWRPLESGISKEERHRVIIAASFTKYSIAADKNGVWIGRCDSRSTSHNTTTLVKDIAQRNNFSDRLFTIYYLFNDFSWPIEAQCFPTESYLTLDPEPHVPDIRCRREPVFLRLYWSKQKSSITCASCLGAQYAISKNKYDLNKIPHVTKREEEIFTAEGRVAYSNSLQSYTTYIHNASKSPVGWHAMSTSKGCLYLLMESEEHNRQYHRDNPSTLRDQEIPQGYCWGSSNKNYIAPRSSIAFVGRSDRVLDACTNVDLPMVLGLIIAEYASLPRPLMAILNSESSVEIALLDIAHDEDAVPKKSSLKYEVFKRHTLNSDICRDYQTILCSPTGKQLVIVCPEKITFFALDHNLQTTLERTFTQSHEITEIRYNDEGSCCTLGTAHGDICMIDCKQFTVAYTKLPDTYEGDYATAFAHVPCANGENPLFYIGTSFGALYRFNPTCFQESNLITCLNYQKESCQDLNDPKKAISKKSLFLASPFTKIAYLLCTCLLLFGAYRLKGFVFIKNCLTPSKAC